MKSTEILDKIKTFLGEEKIEEQVEETQVEETQLEESQEKVLILSKISVDFILL